MDLTRLTGEEFELLCGRLLQASGHAIQRQAARAEDVGIDFSFIDDRGATWVADVKHYRGPLAPTPIFRRAAAQLHAARTYLAADHALLISSVLLPTNLKAELARRESINIWDGADIRALLQNHPEVERDIMALLDVQYAVRRGLDERSLLDQRATELIARLESLPPDRTHWREFEELCVEILNYSLIPPLGVPTVQSRTENGLEILDATYPVTASVPFWDEIKRMCLTRFAVAEFKNCADGITRPEVESLRQYLCAKAMRTFGMLYTRCEPSDSAEAARRRAWVEAKKLIVILSDEDLKDLVRAKSYGENASAVIDARLDDFFLHLSP